jgi:hypothetical protein
MPEHEAVMIFYISKVRVVGLLVLVIMCESSDELNSFSK